MTLLTFTSTSANSSSSDNVFPILEGSITASQHAGGNRDSAECDTHDYLDLTVEILLFILQHPGKAHPQKPQGLIPALLDPLIGLCPFDSGGNRLRALTTVKEGGQAYLPGA